MPKAEIVEHELCTKFAFTPARVAGDTLAPDLTIKNRVDESVCGMCTATILLESRRWMYTS